MDSLKRSTSVSANLDIRETTAKKVKHDAENFLFQTSTFSIKGHFPAIIIFISSQSSMIVLTLSHRMELFIFGIMDRSCFVFIATRQAMEEVLLLFLNYVHRFCKLQSSVFMNMT